MFSQDFKRTGFTKSISSIRTSLIGNLILIQSPEVLGLHRDFDLLVETRCQVAILPGQLLYWRRRSFQYSG